MYSYSLTEVYVCTSSRHKFRFSLPSVGQDTRVIPLTLQRYLGDGITYYLYKGIFNERVIIDIDENGVYSFQFCVAESCDCCTYIRAYPSNKGNECAAVFNNVLGESATMLYATWGSMSFVFNFK